MSLTGPGFLPRALRVLLLLAECTVLLMPVHAFAEKAPKVNSGSAIIAPGCENANARECLELALNAMGGKQRLAAVKTLRLDVVGHTDLPEQSYRQAPFITSYERDQTVIDYAGQRLLQKQHSVWPEADLRAADSDTTLVVSGAGGVYRLNGKDSPCSGADLETSRQTLALGPARILLTADKATDLHFVPTETLRSTPHTVLAFTWEGIPVRILLNRFNHLPDAVRTRQAFRDFWFYWGDVDQVTYFDNWRFVGGIEYPSNQIIERNGIVWSSSQALDIDFNAAIDERDFAIDPKAALLSKQSKGWNRSFKNDQDKQLAPGIDLFVGSWNTTIVKQNDGVLILETPISATFTQGIFDEAKARYPGEPIKAVLSTSDSWPHIGGIRLDVAQGFPVYILDLNQPLLDRVIAAPHTIDPDLLEHSKKKPDWRIVSGKVEIGAGENRVVLFPIRGASTERQYMAYFPERGLLYASDTLVINDDNTLYDPELMREVREAVEREHLTVNIVYAMHQAPVEWAVVLSLLDKSKILKNVS
jgi:hypothetical protein